MRRAFTLVLILAAACSSKSPPSSGEAPRPTHPANAVASLDRPAAPVARSTPATASPDPREAALSAVVTRLLEQEHLLRKKLDDGISREAFNTYVTRLDPGKMFLLAADRAALLPYADKIDDELRAGTLTLAHEGQRRFVAQVAMVEAMVSSLLSAPFDHDNEEWLELDADKTQLATTEQELRERWRRRLELEVLERVATMDARLEAAAKAKAKPKAATKPAPKDKPGAKEPTNGSGDEKAEDDDDALGTPIAKIPTTPEGRELKAREDLAKSYAGRFARLRTPAVLDAASDLINAVASTLDPHTTYLPPADKANFDIHMSGSLEGIGAVLRERDHYIEIVELVPGGAAWRQGGLTPGDVILSVAAHGKAPVDTLDMRIDEVVKMIRGPKGTIVHLQIQKAAGTQETIAITRDVVVLEEAYAKAAIIRTKGGPAYGYIHVPSFYGGQKGRRSAAGDVKLLLREIGGKKVVGVILDLRGNGGGILGDAIDMTGHLIPGGPVVQVQDSRGKRESHDDDNPAIEYAGPVVVMVDRFSASASEIVAGALQDYHRAVIVGTGPTHGKGTVQTLADLDRATGGQIELGVLKITIQQFFRPNGASTQREGVMPDVVLPDPAGHIDSGERKLDHAIAWSKIPAAKFGAWPITWKPQLLTANSAARVAKHPVLGKIAATTAVLKTRQQDTRVPLARKAWKQRRDDLRAALDAASPDLKKTPAKLVVTALDPTAAPTVAGKPDDRAARWRDSIARDPWIEETIYILGDMAK